MDYKKIGFKAGLEIHQQLDTHKLFCKCSSEIINETDYSFTRFLRPTQSELGDVDQAALAEASKNRCFLYTASIKSTCLVEADEEPPHNANSDAVDTCLTMAVLLNCDIVDEIHFMRKIVIDGSNTSGFQRTGLIALNGKIDNVGIQTIALEEDAARKIEEKGKIVNYGLDRLGIPLIEISTEPDILNPDHARKTAEKIGLLLRATGKVKRGLGTIRQDINISVTDGARVEIKGVQSLSSISKVAENEAIRQLGLIKIKEILVKRIKIKDLEDIIILDITKNLQSCKSNIFKKLIKDGCAKVIKLPGFKGLLKREESRLGKEFAVHAKLVCGIGGIIHSDELPGYGFVNKDVNDLCKVLRTNENDAFVIAIGKEIIVDTALKTVIDRAKTSFFGVPNEVRRVLEDDTTEYLRPMPGAARMYPETDIQPIRVTKEKIKDIIKILPERPEEKIKRFLKQYDLNKEQVKQLLSSGYENDFERLVKKYPRIKNIIIRTLLNTLSELEQEDIDASIVTEEMLSNVFSGLLKQKYAKEALPMILKYLAMNPETTIDNAIKNCGLSSVDTKEIKRIIQKIIHEKKDIVKKKGIDAIGPLMGLVMKELRGKADGRLISDLLKKEIEKIL